MSRDETAAAPRRAVVIGGAGFLGRRTVALLAGTDPATPTHPDWPRFDEVHVVDRVAPRDLGGAAGHARITHAVGDIRSKDDLRRALAGAHTVFHLASLVDVGLRRNPDVDAVNVQGTRNVVEVCEELGVPYLVYTSSEDVVFSETPCAGADESLPYPTRPMHDYVRTKIEGERAVREADGRRGLRTCCIRPVHIYGPEDPHAILETLRAFAAKEVPFLFGDGSARFDCVYVDNVVHGHLLAARRLHDEGTRERVGGRAYFVGEGYAPNYFDFVRPFAEERGIRMPTRRIPNRGVLAIALGMELVHRLLGVDVPFHRFHYYILTKDFFFSNANAERDLGYRPLVSPSEGLARTRAWVRTAALPTKASRH